MIVQFSSDENPVNIHDCPFDIYDFSTDIWLIYWHLYWPIDIHDSSVNIHENAIDTHDFTSDILNFPRDIPEWSNDTHDRRIVSIIFLFTSHDNLS